MLVKNIPISNPVGAIRKIREYKAHFRFPIDWNLISENDQQLYRDIFGADKSQLRLSLIIPVVDGLISLNQCKLHNSKNEINPSFDAICRVDDYVLLNNGLPDYCGINVSLTSEEKVNIMCLIG